jgi:hypothetical protein
MTYVAELSMQKYGSGKLNIVQTVFGEAGSDTMLTGLL